MCSEIKLNPSLWTRRGETFVRGHAFDNEDYRDSSELVNLVQETETQEELLSLLSSLNGYFSVVIDKANELILAADRMRTGPVFYAVVDESLVVSDNCGWIPEQLPNLTEDKLSEIEYETSRFVTGSNTLYEEIKQLQSGEVVIFDKESKNRSTIQRQNHTTTGPIKYDKDKLREQFQQVLDNVFERVVEVADGRPIVVPLSGGYDSRLIALMLKRFGYEDVITFTINTGGENARVAKQVADNLGYPWKTANLCHQDWKRFFNSENWDDYFEQSAFLGSLPHPTGVPALLDLISTGEIPENALFVPGHSALDSMKATPVEFEGGREVELPELTEAVVEQHYKYNEHIDIPVSRIQERVAETINFGSQTKPKSAVEAFERWRLKERRAKLIVNGVRAYDYCGCDWWIPLEDKEMYEFWRTVPRAQKRHRNFYEEYIEELYCDVAGVSKEEAGLIADGDLKSRISSRIRGRTVEDAIRSFYRIWDESRIKSEYVRHFRLKSIYDNDPRYGIMTEQKLKETYNGQSFLFFSLLAQSVTGKIDLHS